MKTLPFFFFAFLSLVSCQEPQARKPIYQSNKINIQASVERNKKINQQQQQLIAQAIKKDSVLNYQSSAFGYWFAIQRKAPTKPKPIAGDEVTFNYKIQNLSGKVIYDEIELGEVNYLVDKEDLLPALRYAVKELKETEIGVFLMPSFLGYGYQGDGDKIGINQPLRFTIQLNSLKKTSANLDSK